MAGRGSSVFREERESEVTLVMMEKYGGIASGWSGHKV